MLDGRCIAARGVLLTEARALCNEVFETIMVLDDANEAVEDMGKAVA